MGLDVAWYGESLQNLLVLSIVAALLAAGCTSLVPSDGAVNKQAVSGGTGGVGGAVKDVRGTITSFVSDKATGDNSGSTLLTFTGIASDGNGEQDIAFIAAASTGPLVMSVNHSVTSAERGATTEPTTYSADGTKVWNPVAKDGALSFKWQVTITAFTTPGNYTFTATEGNPSGVTSLPSAGVLFVVTSFSSITVSAAPVDITGAAQTGSNWGAWTASPGDSNVVATNFLQLTNTGDIANSAVVVDFTEAAFTGSDANYSIPVDNNLQFAFCDVPAGTAPSACALNYTAVSPGGSVTVTFAGKGHLIFLSYRVVAVPRVLAAQSYGAHFTVTEL